MRFRKRLGTGILSAMMVVSSLQLPGGVSYAAEIPVQMETAESGTDKLQDLPEEESGQADSISDAEAEVPSDIDEEAENPLDESDIAGDTVDTEETAAGEQISGNDVGVDVDVDETAVAESSVGPVTETLIEDEMEGVYQFGGAPSGQGRVSTMSVSTYNASAETYIYQQLKSRQSTIDVSSYNLDADTLRSLVSGVLNEHPDLYFVKKGYSFYSSGSTITRIVFTMDHTLDDDAVQSAVNRALSTVKEGMSDLEKAIVLHDYLVVNCEYDKENYDANTIPDASYTIYGVFAKRTAVCEGYALAYKYLLNQVGINCYMVSSSSMNHAWNMIVLNGKYYQVDVTWDDPTWDQIGRAMHTYMFRSDAAFEKHSNWQVTSGSNVVNYVASDTSYDSAFWTTCRSPLVITGNDCYYASSDGYIRKTGLSKGVTSTGTEVQSVGTWPVWGGSGWWDGSYSGLFLADGRLFYNDKSSIYSIALDGTGRRTEFTANTSTGYIYGSAYCQGKVFYSLHQTPNLSAKEEVLVSDITISAGESDVSVESIVLDKNTLELKEGEEEKLSVTISPEAAAGTVVNWGSSDTRVATVDNSGTVRAVSAGSCTVTAMAGGKMASCNVTVTAEEVDEALNLENTETQYVTLDDTKISSRAEGRPKLLIFYGNSCFNCQASIGSIRDNISDFAGVDIFAIEIQNNTRESVSLFREQYGCDEITFSYDTGYTNADSMWSYLRKSGYTDSSAKTPVICYIDADNRFQYVTQSISMADTVLSNLKKYCKYVSQTEEIDTYTITYVLNGGTNDMDNPGTYTSETEEIILKDATREGYRFDGWYEEASFQTRRSRIPKGSTGNITLYAKWSPASSGNIPKIDIKPEEGNIVVRFQGDFDTAGAQVILNKLNKIRNGAEPLKWSADLEAIARLRAVETSINNNTGTRPNGKNYNTVTTNNGISITYERLGYHADGMLAELDQDAAQYFSENISNPDYHFVGVGAFRLDNGTGSSDGLYRVIITFSNKNDLDQTKDNSKGRGEQDIEMKPNAVKKLRFDTESTGIKRGESCQLPLIVTVTGKDPYGGKPNYSGVYQSGGTWSSSDETVATVDGNGVVTGRSAGKTTITVKIGGKKASADIYVQSEFPRGTEVTLKNSSCTYSGRGQQPKVEVSVSNTVLQEGLDYELTYENNVNVGTATLTVNGTRYYYGSISRNFEIKPVQLIIRAKDKAILTGARIPTGSQYEYETEGLCENDILSREPSFICSIESSEQAGRYEIVPYGADAGTNYEITYEHGRLSVADEYVSYAVSFDMMGHGEAIADYFGIRAGAMIDQPEPPEETGYRFGGWFRDAACTKAWDFESDVVQSDLTLYAGWFNTGSNGSFALQEIADVYYTGKACRPAVKVYDDDVLLKAGRDYQIKYYNNINANEGNARKSGNGQGSYFKETLPYVEIIGKGDYTEIVKMNFNILKASIGDGSEKTPAGVSLKVSDQLVKAKKTLKPFNSIKASRAMKRDKDFTVSLKPVKARDEKGQTLSINKELDKAEIPAGYEGEFQLLVKGTGNYEGSISRTVLVTDKAHLMKNAKITLGKNLKNIAYAGDDEIRLTPSEESSDDTFTVKCGNNVLQPGIDYIVKYDRHPKPGKAELTVIGINAYVGSKTVTFTVKGKTFSARTVEVEGIQDRIYTGWAQTQNGVTLTYSDGSDTKRKLAYGTDYTISYSKNINKGTATMIFSGKGEACFAGSFKKTFQITEIDISAGQVSYKMQPSAFSYCKAGVKPEDELVLTNREGFVLRSGRDYTLKYTNNKAVANASGANPPTITVKGRGNYTGELDVHFSINKAELTIDNIKASPIAYKSGRAGNYTYTPAIKVIDGKTALRVGKDYEIEYRNNTQTDYESYMSGAAARMPQAVITAQADSNYRTASPIIVPLPVRNKLTKSNLEVKIGEAMYTGRQVTPEVQVYYIAEGGKKTLLRKDTDYLLTYGANVKSGKNKGSVRISGIAPHYGGDVTVKFEIKKKPISGKL